jgi:hypothetical protein
MKSDPRSHTMSFAATRELKEWIEKTAQKRAMRVSRFVSSLAEQEKAKEDAEQNQIPE